MHCHVEFCFLPEIKVAILNIKIFPLRIDGLKWLLARFWIKILYPYKRSEWLALIDWLAALFRNDDFFHCIFAATAKHFFLSKNFKS